MKNRLLYAAFALLIAVAFNGCATDTGAPSSGGSIAPSGSSGGSIGSH